jgi:glucokinase
VGLPVLDAQGFALWEHFRATLPAPPDAECAVSGPGIAAIFAFLLASGGAPRSPRTEQLQALPLAERPAAIAQSAGADPACARTMELFVDLYARVCAELCAVFLPTGGLYLAGGIAAKNAPRFLDEHRFMRAFERNCRPHLDGLTRQTPVFMVLDYAVSLPGAAFAGCLATDSAGAD